MKFEQPKQWNCFVDESIPLTWSYRWKVLKIVAPLLAFSAVLMIETILLRAWMEGWPPASIVQRLLVGTLPICALCAFFFEISLRSGHSSKRIFEINEKALWFRQRDRQWKIPWQCLFAILIEPIPGEPALAKVNVLGTLGKTPRIRTWSIVLDRAKQLPSFLSELQIRHQLYGFFTVRELRDPLPARKVRSAPSIWRYWLGAILILHGMFFTIPAFADKDRESETDHSPKKVSPGFEQFLLKHFKSHDELRKFFLITGGVLAGFGGLLIAYDLRTINRGRKKRDEETNREIEMESERPGTVILNRVQR